jgi:hypothetical protein
MFVHESLWRFRDATEDWIIDGTLGWKQKPNLDVDSSYDGKLVHFKTNPDGTQSAGNPTGVKTILILGDSTVVGRAVPDGRRIHDFICRLWKAQTEEDVFVVNGGVQGYSTDQSFIQLGLLGEQYRPSIVLYAMCDNDLLQNSSPRAHSLPKPIFALCHRTLVMTSPGAPPKAIPRFGSGLSRLAQSSALYRVLQPSLYFLRQKLGLGKSSTPGDVQKFSDYVSKVDWDLFAAILVAMRDWSTQHGAKFYLYKHPSLEEVWLPYRRAAGLTASEAMALETRIATICRAANVAYIPMTDYFLERQEKGPFHLIPGDPHANTMGYAIQAEIIVNHIVSEQQSISEQ